MTKIDGHNILTIGCNFDPPKGGIAQVLYTYHEEVYEHFHFVANSGPGSKVKKIWIAVQAYIRMSFLLLLNRNIQIVHIHTASNNSFRRSAWFVRLAKFMHRKVILHIHGGGFKEYFRTRPQWINSILRKCDAIITLTEGWKNYFVNDLHLEDVFVVPNVISSPHRNPIPHDRFTLLFLGLVCEEKGIFDLLNVIKEHKDEWNDTLLLLIGGNGETDRLIKEIEENGLDHIVHFEGWVSGEKKIQLFNMSDALILPSYTEGLPVSILEAMSYGLPILATPVGGIPEVVIDGVSGFYFSAGNKNDIYQSINKLMHSKTELKTMSENNLRKANEHLPNFVANNLNRLYNVLVS